MNLFFRLFLTLLRYRFKKPVPILGPCTTSFRCWPTDLDTFMHMNNGRYFSIMDLARIDYMGRAGLLKEFSKRGWYPLVVAETARFKKSIEPFERFDIQSKVIGWDDKAILIQQSFIRDGVTVCEAVVRSRFLKKTGGTVSISEILDATGITHESPELESWVAHWNAHQV